jgi:NADH:ubiquinone oxidoreductase subunit 6 (subunit J)
MNDIQKLLDLALLFLIVSVLCAFLGAMFQEALTMFVILGCVSYVVGILFAFVAHKLNKDVE